jgi:hypothetical protein
MSRTKQATPAAKRVDAQVLLRELQKALAVARCIRIAAEYAEDDALDLADALAGLLILMQRTAASLDQPEVSL